MDETDTQLIALLQENARMPVADLARVLGLARTTVQARLERLEQRGVILGYTVILGAEALPPLRATILLQIEPRTTADVLSKLKSIPGIVAVSTTSGRFDLLVEVASQTSDALDKMIDQIVAARGVTRSESLIQLTTKIDRRT